VFNAELLEVLCCPKTHQALQVAEPAVIARLNELIAQGTLQNSGGQSVTDKIEGGLIRADRKVLYLIRQNMPVMLAEQAIPLPP